MLSRLAFIFDCFCSPITIWIVPHLSLHWKTWKGQQRPPVKDASANIIKEQYRKYSKLDKNITKIGLRPENIELGNGPYEGKVISTENLGSETVVAINFQDNEILASIQGSYKSSINEKINFDINTNKVLKFDKGDQRIYER